ncbi:MAG: penicillin-binding protein 2 [Leptospirales bacterium]
MVQYTRARGLSGLRSRTSPGINQRLVPGIWPFLALVSTPRGRLRVLLVFLAMGFLVLLTRLFDVQINQHEKYLKLAKGNILRVIPLPPLRGSILDRNGEILVSNGTNFVVSMIPDEVQDEGRTLAQLGEDLAVPPEELQDALDRVRDILPSYIPVPLRAHMTIAQVGRVRMDLYHLPGIIIQTIPERTYVQNKMAAHLLGYVGSLSVVDMKNSYSRHLPPGTGIGKTGIEKEFDGVLQGTPGESRKLVDSQGSVIKKLLPKNPMVGHSIKLTIDSRLERVAEDALGDRRGAVVAMDPRNGEILALVSHPTFDPNEISSSLTASTWHGLLNDPDHPLTNRAIQGLYPPGSVFKVVTTMAGLKEGVIDPKKPFNCKGIVYIGGWPFHDWKKGGHGILHLRRAIMQSCDIYFYRAGIAIGPDHLAEMARTFGLGQRTGVDLPSEVAGNVPDREWKKNRLHQPWYPGETLPFAIGQGYLTVTPLQMARLMGVVATRGVLVKPHIFLSFDEHPSKSQPQAVGDRLPFANGAFGPLREGLWAVVNEPHGTGHPVRMKEMEIAGKTGTAQVISNRLPKNGGTRIKIRPDSWFVGFAPFKNPEIVVSVLIENGGDGGDVAGPVAKAVFQEFYKDYLATPEEGSQVRTMQGASPT